MQERNKAIPGQGGILVRRAQPLLDEVLGKGGYLLGGGTSLALRWDHRDSIDADLFVRESSAARWALAARAPELRTRLEELLPNHHVETTASRVRVFEERRPDEAVLSVFTWAAPWPPPAHRRKCSEGIGLLEPAEVLEGKLSGRMWRDATLTARDLYDVACAAELDRGELARALSVLSAEARREIAARIEQVATKDWWMSQEAGRPVRGARRPATLAAAPWKASRICVERIGTGTGSRGRTTQRER